MNTKNNFKAFERDENGLLSHVEYFFKEDSSINWRAMVKPEHTVLNLQYKPEIEQKYQKRVEDIKVNEVEDKFLLILLAGFKELAYIRGYNSVTYDVVKADRDFVAAKCRIVWTPNFETNGKELVFESLADANSDTTSGFASKYLMAIAENRAFVRCVRNSLGVHIVGADEIGPRANSGGSNKSYGPSEPKGVLQSLLDQKNISFDKFKNWAEAHNPDAKNWSGIQDVPSFEVFSLLEKIKKK